MTRAVDLANSVANGVSLGFKNRIINGAMMIDQRNAGASVTINAAGRLYTIDRFLGQGTTASGVFTMQRSTVAPSGFTNSLLTTVTTADASLAAGDIYIIAQDIEGFNIADLGFGTASASTITLSFWVRCSVTGTFGGAFGNNDFNRSYPFTYTINSANTWEYKTITVSGDTTGTWATNNAIGLRVYLSLGSGSTYSAAANSWQAGGYLTANGVTNLMATNGATLYLTGVQLEVGSTATNFEYRDYGRELYMCQRYYQTSNAVTGIANTSTTQIASVVSWQTTMRATPTIGLTGVYSMTDGYAVDVTQTSATIGTVFGAGANASFLLLTSFSGLTSARAYMTRFANTNAITLSAEL